MIVSRRRNPLRPTIKLHDHVIEYVENFKLLGVTVSSDLSWRFHISEIVSKTKRLLGFIYHVFREGSDTSVQDNCSSVP